MTADNPYNPAAREKRAVLRDRQRRDAKFARHLERQARGLGGRLAQRELQSLDARAVEQLGGESGLSREIVNVNSYDDAQIIARACGVRVVDAGGGGDLAYTVPVPMPPIPVHDPAERPGGRRVVTTQLYRDIERDVRRLANSSEVAVESRQDAEEHVLQTAARLWYTWLELGASS